MVYDFEMTYRLVIKNTFYDVQLEVEAPRRSSQSAPPRLRGFPARSSRGRRVARLRKRERLHAENCIFDEYAAAVRGERCCERWAAFSAGSRAGDARARLDAARAARSEVPRLRLELPCRLFTELAAIVFASEADALLLVRLRVLRFGGDEAVQIWSSEDALGHVVVQSLLLTGRSLLAMARDGLLQVFVRGAEPRVVRWGPHLSVSDVVRALLLRGVASTSYILLHLRAPLGQGLLAELGVGPGSCLFLQPTFVQI